MKKYLVLAPLFIAMAVMLAGIGAKSAPAKIDAADWLHKKDVKLLAVTFYAAFDRACEAYAPRWDKMIKAYKDKGLRVIVVIEPVAGSCEQNVTFKADEVICDADGSIAETMRAETDKPQNFLWNWRGDMLLYNGGINELQAAVEDFYKYENKILIADENYRYGKPSKEMDAVIKMVKAEIEAQTKLNVAKDKPSEDDIFDKVEKIIKDPQYKGGKKCAENEWLSNELLMYVSYSSAKGAKKLSLDLYSAYKMCYFATATVEDKGNVKNAIKEAVKKLNKDLTSGVKLPAPMTDAEKKSATLILDSDPSGATAEVWGPESFHAFQTLPAKIANLKSGSYKIDIAAKGYEREEMNFDLAEGELRAAKTFLIPAKKAEAKEQLVQAKKEASSEYLKAEGELVIDPIMNLTWQRGHSKEPMNYKEAVAYCKTLELEDEKGFRLPKINELRALIRGCNAPNSCGDLSSQKEDCVWCDKGKGPGDRGSYLSKGLWQGKGMIFWSESLLTKDTSRAWYVNYEEGHIYSYDKNSKYYVRCVKGGL